MSVKNTIIKELLKSLGHTIPTLILNRYFAKADYKTTINAADVSVEALKMHRHYR